MLHILSRKYSLAFYFFFFGLIGMAKMPLKGKSTPAKRGMLKQNLCVSSICVEIRTLMNCMCLKEIGKESVVGIRVK